MARIERAAAAFAKSAEDYAAEYKKHIESIKKADEDYQKELKAHGESVKKTNEEFVRDKKKRDEATAHEAALAGSTTTKQLFGALQKVVDRNMGGATTQDIRRAMTRAKKHAAEATKAQARTIKLGKEISTAQAALPGASYNQKIKLQAEILKKSQQAAASAAQYQAAISRTKQALVTGRTHAAGALGNVPTPLKFPPPTPPRPPVHGKPPGKLAGVLGRAGGALGAAGRLAGGALGGAVGVGASLLVKTFGELNHKIQESIAIIDKYAKFSIGGLHAAASMQITAIRRDISISHMIQDDMMEFAKANNERMMAWKQVDAFTSKIFLKIGTLTANLMTTIGGVLSQFVNSVEKFIKVIYGWFGAKYETMEEKALRNQQNFRQPRNPQEAVQAAMMGFRPGRIQLPNPNAGIPKAGENLVEKVEKFVQAILNPLGLIRDTLVDIKNNFAGWKEAIKDAAGGAGGIRKGPANGGNGIGANAAGGAVNGVVPRLVAPDPRLPGGRGQGLMGNHGRVPF